MNLPPNPTKVGPGELCESVAPVRQPQSGTHTHFLLGVKGTIQALPRILRTGGSKRQQRWIISWPANPFKDCGPLSSPWPSPAAMDPAAPRHHFDIVNLWAQRPTSALACKPSTSQKGAFLGGLFSCLREPPQAPRLHLLLGEYLLLLT